MSAQPFGSMFNLMRNGIGKAAYLQPLLEGEVLAMPPEQRTRLNNVQGYWKYGTHLRPQ